MLVGVGRRGLLFSCDDEPVGEPGSVEPWRPYVLAVALDFLLTDDLLQGRRCYMEVVCGLKAVVADGGC